MHYLQPPLAAARQLAPGLDDCGLERNVAFDVELNMFGGHGFHRAKIAMGA